MVISFWISKIGDNFYIKKGTEALWQSDICFGSQMKLVDALVESLAAWDLRYVFGVSGANIEHVHDAIHRLGDPRLVSIMSKCETGAAFMADCRARVHRTLGVCCSTSGGGMVNLLVGIAEAYAESVPVLALVGQPPTNLEGKGAFQDSSAIGRSVDAMKLWGAVSKYVARISRPEDFWRCLMEAVKAALSGRPGPAVLLLNRDVYEQEVGERPAPWPENLQDFMQPKEIAAGLLRPALDELRRCRKPVIIIGHGVRRCSSPQAVIRFAQRAGIPVITSMSGKGEFPNDDPLYLGMVGVAGHPSAHAYLREEADLILVIGAGLNIMTRAPIATFLNEKKIVAINIDTGEISRALPSAIAIEADAGIACSMLDQMLEAEAPAFAQRNPGYKIEEFAPLLAPPIQPDERAQPLETPLLQSEAIKLLTELLPRSGHVLFDAGNCAAAALHMTLIPPGVSSTIALGMGGMGYAIAAAIGAQLNSPAGARAIVFCGDGAFLMVGFEIHTAVDLQLPILFVIFNNNMHGMCVTRQQLFFGSRLECVRYAPLNVAETARGFGDPTRLWVGSASTVKELQAQIEDYKKHLDITGVLELRLLREEVPPFTPFLPADAKTTRISAGKQDIPG